MKLTALRDGRNTAITVTGAYLTRIPPEAVVDELAQGTWASGRLRASDLVVIASAGEIVAHRSQTTGRAYLVVDECASGDPYSDNHTVELRIIIEPISLDPQQIASLGYLFPIGETDLDTLLSGEWCKVGPSEADHLYGRDPVPCTWVRDDDDIVGLFEDVTTGLQANGAVLVDLDWAAFMIGSELGIEHIVGFAGFSNAHAFMQHLQIESQSPLPDWVAIEVTLYQCWYPPLSGDWPTNRWNEPESAFCYSAWRTAPDKDSIAVQERRVFALRHKAWSLTKSRSEASFTLARQRSYAEAVAVRAGRDPGNPQIMASLSDVGFYLTGVAPGDTQNRDRRLTWPSLDLHETIRTGDQFIAASYTDIHLCGGGVGMALAGLSDAARALLYERYRIHGEDACFTDLITGIVSTHRP